MSQWEKRKWRAAGGLLLVVLCVTVLLASAQAREASAAPTPGAGSDPQYVVLAWNDLGMHCYNRDFQDLAVLPPYNTLWAQVIRVGDPPQIVTSGIEVTYFFEDNTYSTGKSNFWATSPYRPVQNAQWLFAALGVTQPLPNNVGLTGKGLSGEMDLLDDHFVAEGIPLTEFRDSHPNTPYPYQIATVVVRDAATGAELARTQPVAPVSTEMHCEYCHADNGEGNEHIATGRVETNILTLHDNENMDEYPDSLSGPLMNRRPVLCAWCHASAALKADGIGEIPNLSRAMHHKHDEEGLPSNLATCYSCHPGPRTQCMRGVMSTQYEKDCIDCHGGLSQVAQNPKPWEIEPRCDNSQCHGIAYAQDQDLYRMSKEHGGVYCEACHDSTHAIAPSREANDAIKFVGWQGHNGPIDTCTVCHASWPTGAGPHGLTPPTVRSFTFEPDYVSTREPGTQAIYAHTLTNNGNEADSYTLTWNSSQGWASVVAPPPPLSLGPGQEALVTVTVTIPNGEAFRGLLDTTVVTATSTTDSSLVEIVVDRTLVPAAYIYLPIIARNG
jgi:hypothetical protein